MTVITHSFSIRGVLPEVTESQAHESFAKLGSVASVKLVPAAAHIPKDKARQSLYVNMTACPDPSRILALDGKAPDFQSQPISVRMQKAHVAQVALKTGEIAFSVSIYNLHWMVEEAELSGAISGLGARLHSVKMTPPAKPHRFATKGAFVNFAAGDKAKVLALNGTAPAWNHGTAISVREQDVHTARAAAAKAISAAMQQQQQQQQQQGAASPGLQLKTKGQAQRAAQGAGGAEEAQGGRGQAAQGAGQPLVSKKRKQEAEAEAEPPAPKARAAEAPSGQVEKKKVAAAKQPPAAAAATTGGGGLPSGGLMTAASRRRAAEEDAARAQAAAGASKQHSQGAGVVGLVSGSKRKAMQEEEDRRLQADGRKKPALGAGGGVALVSGSKRREREEEERRRSMQEQEAAAREAVKQAMLQAQAQKNKDMERRAAEKKAKAAEQAKAKEHNPPHAEREKRGKQAGVFGKALFASLGGLAGLKERVGAGNKEVISPRGTAAAAAGRSAGAAMDKGGDRPAKGGASDKAAVAESRLKPPPALDTASLKKTIVKIATGNSSAAKASPRSPAAAKRAQPSPKGVRSPRGAPSPKAQKQAAAAVEEEAEAEGEYGEGEEYYEEGNPLDEQEGFEGGDGEEAEMSLEELEQFAKSLE